MSALLKALAQHKATYAAEFTPGPGRAAGAEALPIKSLTVIEPKKESQNG